jgi:hypothetical protein
MMATHAIYSLQLIVESFSTGVEQVAPATIRDDSSKLIDMLASEGESVFDKTTIALCSEGAQPAPTILCNKLCRRGLVVDFIPTTSNPLLPPVLNGSATSHLLLLCIHECSEIMIIAIMMTNDPFQLIVISVSEGACTAPITFNAKRSKLIVVYVKKIKTSLHFRKACGIFCEGEWEEQNQQPKQDLINHNRIIGHNNLIDLIGFIGHNRRINFGGFNGIINLIGLVGRFGLINGPGLVSHIDVDLIGHNGIGLFSVKW